MADALKRKKPSTMTDAEKETNRLAKTRHMLDCRVCEIESAMVPGNVTSFTCGSCTQLSVPAPVLAEKQNKKKLKYDFGRGWWRKILFSTEVEGETKFFSRGEEITEAKFNEIKAEQEAVANAPKRPRGRPKNGNGTPKPAKREGFGRGWHLKKHFEAPDGTVYKFGKAVK